MKTIARNRKAGFNYQHLEKVIAGLSLYGWQVKSIKAGNVSISEAYAYVKAGEVFLHGANISEWEGMSDFARENVGKDIKVLMKKQEINKWEGKLKQKQATTIIPLRLIVDRGLIKVELALAKGVKKYEKRGKIREKEQKKEISRQLKEIYEQRK